MRQTTSGEIRKYTKIYNRKEVEKFLDKNLNEFNRLKKMKKCLYDNLTAIDDPSLNYINTVNL